MGGDHIGQREHDSTESLLQELPWTYGPCGQEEAVRTVCARKLQTLVDDMWTDDAGNLIGYIGADDAESPSG
jgi:putative aminopeptidase FrvX